EIDLLKVRIEAASRLWQDRTDIKAAEVEALTAERQRYREKILAVDKRYRELEAEENNARSMVETLRQELRRKDEELSFLVKSHVPEEPKPAKPELSRAALASQEYALHLHRTTQDAIRQAEAEAGPQPDPAEAQWQDEHRPIPADIPGYAELTSIG